MIGLRQEKRNWVIDLTWLSFVHFLEGVGAVGGLNEQGAPSVGRKLTPDALKDAGVNQPDRAWAVLCVLEVCERVGGFARYVFKSVSASNYPPRGAGNGPPNN
jgi:hypothetical protein